MTPMNTLKTALSPASGAAPAAAAPVVSSEARTSLKAKYAMSPVHLFTVLNAKYVHST